MLKIYIQDTPGSIYQNLFVFGKDYPVHGKNSFLEVNQNGDVIVTTITQEEMTKLDVIRPLIKNLPIYTMNEILQAFVDYAKEKGMEYESESKAKGKLEVMEQWVGDLRTLLKLK